MFVILDNPAAVRRAAMDLLARRDVRRLMQACGASEERTRIVDAFQRGEGLGVALTVRAGGVGIDLYRADAMIFVDRDWNPAMNEQCEDRLHRIGQTRPVTIYVLDAGTWIEDRVEELNRDKQRMIAAHAAIGLN